MNSVYVLGCSLSTEYSRDLKKITLSVKELKILIFLYIRYFDFGFGEIVISAIGTCLIRGLFFILNICYKIMV